jgi:small conductance mechanosensitive channel
MENTMDFDKFLEDSPDLIMTFGIQLVTALIIFVIGKWVARLITNFLRNMMEKKSVDPTVSGFVANLSYALLLTFVIIAALGQLGVQTASFVAIIGAAGLAVGFALQGSLSNFAAGVMMLIFRPAKVGDFIEAAGISGVVDEITVFSTRLKTGDNKVVICPNSAVMGGNIINYSTMPTRRIDLVIGISYDADIKQAKSELEGILSSESRVLQDPAPTIGVSELADSSVNLVVRPWVATGDYWPTYFALLEAIKVRFDEVGIGIPYPQMDVTVVSHRSQV